MPIRSIRKLLAVAALVCLFTSACLQLFSAAPSTGAELTHRGYYRFPSVHGDTIVFTSEGDLWSVSIHGGAAQRLTTSPGM